MSVGFGGGVVINDADVTGDLNITGSDLYLLALPLVYTDYYISNGDTPTPYTSITFPGSSGTTLSNVYTSSPFIDSQGYFTGILAAWGLIAPTVTSNTLVGSGAAYDWNQFVAAYFTGVDQTTPFFITPSLYYSQGSVSHTFTGLSDGMMAVSVGVCVGMDQTVTYDIVAGSGLTQLYTGGDDGNQICSTAFGYGEVSGSSFTVEWTGDIYDQGIAMIAGVLNLASEASSGFGPLLADDYFSLII